MCECAFVTLSSRPPAATAVCRALTECGSLLFDLSGLDLVVILFKDHNGDFKCFTHRLYNKWTELPDLKSEDNAEVP